MMCRVTHDLFMHLYSSYFIIIKRDCISTSDLFPHALDRAAGRCESMSVLVLRREEKEGAKEEARDICFKVVGYLNKC